MSNRHTSILNCVNLNIYILIVNLLPHFANCKVTGVMKGRKTDFHNFSYGDQRDHPLFLYYCIRAEILIFIKLF